MKRIAALVLVAALMFSLAACGKTVITAYEEPAFEPDFAAAYASHDPDEVVFTIAGKDATWQMLFYEIAYNTAYLESQGQTITGWSDACTLYQDENGIYYSYGSVILTNAVTLLEQYLIMEAKLDEAGCVADEACDEYIATARQTVIDSSFNGDETAFLEYLSNMYGSEELWDWFNRIDYLYQTQGFEKLYGTDGASYGDEETLAYAEAYDYVGLCQMTVAHQSAQTETDGASGEASVEGSAAAIRTALDAADDKQAAFAELYAAYNTDETLDVYAAGRCVWEEDVEEAVYEAAVALGEYESAVIEGEETDTVILRIPCYADAPVYYDTDTGITYNLRYYAAWQAYYDLVNGEDGWIAAGADTLTWAEGFEELSMDEIFTVEAE